MNRSRILIVEDEMIVSREIFQRLQALGYEPVGRAASAEQALAMLEVHQPDLILMDIRLKGEMDGIATAEIVRRRFHIPVIFLTAYSEDDTLERAKLAEPYGFLLKPFDDRELKSTVEIALYKHQAEEELRRLNRLYDVLSQVNQIIVRVESREKLFPEVCRLLVEHGEVDLAWIARLDPSSFRLETVAHCGDRSEFLDCAEFSADDRPEGQGNPGKAIRKGKPCVCNACSETECLYPSEKLPAGFGFESCGSFPISFQGSVWGTLNICMSRPAFFRQREMELLEEVAVDISFALDKIEGDLQRERAQEALQESEGRLRLFIEHVPAAVAMLDCEMRYISCSRRWLSDYRLGDRDISGLSYDEVFPGITEKWKNIHRRALAGEVLSEEAERFQRSDGSVQWLRWEVRPWRYHAGDIAGVLIFSEDITESKRLEAEIRERGKLFSRIFHESPLPLVISRKADAVLIEINDPFAKASGYSREEAIGRTAFDLNLWVDTLDRDFLFESTERTGSVFNFEMNFRRRSGDVFPALCSTATIEIDGEPCFITTIMDVTESRRTAEEKERLEVQLRHSQKLEAIGILAGGIAHDFNNILSPIIGYTEMSMDDIPDSSQTKCDLKQVLIAANRAKDLVNQILSFSRLGEDQLMRPVDVSLIVKEALKLLRASLPSTIEIEQDVRKVKALANATQIHQIVVNLCTNAAHAMEDSGTLEVCLQEVFLTAHDLRGLSISELKPGNYARLSVRDTGCGMSGDTMLKLFDPYFTTKKVGKGTGLGLAVVHGIVKRHGGEIRVKSELGKGSLFEVLIPLVEKEVKPEAQSSDTLPGGTERILLVDDEQTITEMGVRMLGRLGYQVTPSNHSRDALELFSSKPWDFDLVITDYTMPGMTGTELAREMMEIRKDIPIILCTGFSERISEQEARDMGIKGFAMKPLDRRQLAEIARRAMDHE